MSEYQHPLNLPEPKQLKDAAENAEGGIDWKIVLQITGITIAVLSFVIGAVLNLADTSTPFISNLIYVLLGGNCLLSMWIFWVHENKKLFWLAIIATFLVMYGA